jgi:hypothetical protein
MFQNVQNTYSPERNYAKLGQERTSLRGHDGNPNSFSGMIWAKSVGGAARGSESSEVNGLYGGLSGLRAEYILRLRLQDLSGKYGRGEGEEMGVTH